jgi:hypothetical protein
MEKNVMKFAFLKVIQFTFALVAALALLETSVSPLQAQVNYGTVRGRVTDASGAVIANATVTLINAGTKITRATQTNQAGDYFFTAVAPGTYSVSIQANSFKNVEHKGIIVDLQQTATVDESLSVGATGDTIEVTGTEPLIDTANASGGQIITEDQVQELPNQGRNPFTVNKLDNNVTPVGDPRFVRYEDQNGTDSQSVSGAPLGTNTYVVDGIPISTTTGGVTFVPAVEAVSDVKVQSNTYDAELGRTAGGLFNTSLKSGTDTYHGELFGLTRQNALVANQWWYNHTGVAKPNFTTYQTAAAFGGPLPFSSKYHSLKNTFFWATDANYRQAQPAGGANYYVPTAAERKGDFSLDNVTLYDPTQAFVSGARTAVLPGSVIPSNLINPIGRVIANTFPAADPTASTSYVNSTNYTGKDDYQTRGDEYVLKLDHEFSQRWSLGASYVYLKTDEPGGNVLHTIAASDQNEMRHVDAVALNNVVTLNPTTVLTLGFGYSSYYENQPQYSNGFDQTSGFVDNGGTYGFPAGYVKQLQSQSYPTITLGSISNAASLGGANLLKWNQKQYSYVASIAKTIGKQNLKAGYVFRNFVYHYVPQTLANGSFTFNGEYTTASGSGPTAGPQSIADLLLGLPSSASVQINPTNLNDNIHYQAVYVQDDLRLSSKLTANAGIRYEYEPGEGESANQYNVGFDPSINYQFPGANSQPLAHGGIEFAGQGGYPTRSGSLNHPKVSPRLGISYEVRPGTVVRGGFGVFYGPIGVLTTATTGYSQLTSYATTSGSSLGTATAGPSSWFSNPFNATLLQPSGNKEGALTGVGGAITVPSSNLRPPFVQQYSVDVEQQLPYNIVLKLGYVGAHGRNLANTVNINQLSDSILAEYAPGGVNAGTKLSSSVTNPYYATTVGGYPSTGVIAKKTVALAQTLLPYPQFTSISEPQSTGHSLYNALDVKLQKRFSDGLTAVLAYTWSSNWDNLYGSPVSGLNTLNPNAAAPQDNYNPKGEYSRATNDIPNRFTAAVTYELPVGRGKRFLGGINRGVDAAIGGWKINDVTILENGGALPIVQTDLSSGTFGTTGVGGSTQRPNLVAGVNPCYSGSPKNRLGQYFNLNAFTPALPYTYGNAPRTLACKGPGFLNSDISINKNFKITEKVNLEFRAEALNAFNNPEFSHPNETLTFPSSGAGVPTLTSAAFTTGTTGSITSQLGFSRIIQLGGRLTF